MIDEDSFHDGMKQLNEESQVLDAEIKIINKIIEQQLNKRPPQTIESRDLHYSIYTIVYLLFS